MLIFVAVVHIGSGRPAFRFSIPILFPDPHLAWTQELCIYMFIWMAKFGAAYGVRDRHPCRRRRADQQVSTIAGARWTVLFGLMGGALFTAIVGTMGAKFVIELMSHRSGFTRSGDTELDRLRLHPARLLSDVLPLSCRWCWTYWWTDELPHHDANPCRRRRSDPAPRLRPSRSEKRDECRHYLRTAVCA